MPYTKALLYYGTIDSIYIGCLALSNHRLLCLSSSSKELANKVCKWLYLYSLLRFKQS